LEAKELLSLLGMIGGAVMPLFNIPLIYRIAKRKSAADISLFWLFGVWACILLMLPISFLTSDLTLRLFGICNAVFFTGVVFVTMKYHHRFKKKNPGSEPRS